MKINLLKKLKIKPTMGLEGYATYHTRMLGAPVKAYLEITARCNFRCVHCYLHPLLSKGKKEMTTHEFFSILDQLAEMGTLFLIITGGEPFVRPDFWQIMEHARERGFIIELVTNGSLVTKVAAQRLAALFVNKVSVSIYGMDEGVYKTVTGSSGVFKKVMRGVKLLVEEGVKVEARLILLRENFFQLEAFRRFVKKTGVENSIEWLLSPRHDTSLVPLRHGLIKTQIEKFLHCYPKQYKPDLDFAPFTSTPLCPSRFRGIAINSYGEVRNCILLENSTNIREKSIADIFQKDSFFRRIRRLQWGDVPQCLKCKAKAYCAPCPADYFLHTGNLTPNPPKAMCRRAWMLKDIYERLQK